MPTAIPTWLLAGPGRNWQSATRSTYAASSSHLRRTTYSSRKYPRCATGPPKEVSPRRVATPSTSSALIAAASGGLGRRRAQRQEPPGERRAGARVLVLEEHVGLTPAGPDSVDRLDPALQRFVRVLHGARPSRFATRAASTPRCTRRRAK